MAATLEELEAQRTEETSKGDALVAKLDADGELSADDRQVLRQVHSNLNTLSEQIAELNGDAEAVEAIKESRAAEKKAQSDRADAARRAKFGKGAPVSAEEAFRTLGDSYVESESYKGWMKRFGSGAPSSRSTVFADPFVPDQLAFRSALDVLSPSERKQQAAMRAGLVTAGSTSAGGLLQPDWRGLLEPGLVRPLTIRQLVTSIPAGSDSIEYAQEKSRTYGAAPVAEATALTGTSGTKPSSDISWEKVTDTMHTIAVWIALTKKIIANENQLRNYVDQFIMDDLALELEDQIIGGDGSGENFMGVLHETGVQTQAADAGPFYALRKAMTLLRTNAQVAPTAIAMHPNDVEQLDLTVVNSEVNHFLGAGPFGASERTVWRTPIVESLAVTENTAIVGDWRRAVLYVGEEATLTVGTVNDDFIRNIVRLLGEEVFGFGILRPKAFVKVTL